MKEIGKEVKVILQRIVRSQPGLHEILSQKRPKHQLERAKQLAALASLDDMGSVPSNTHGSLQLLLTSSRKLITFYRFHRKYMYMVNINKHTCSLTYK